MFDKRDSGNEKLSAGLFQTQLKSLVKRAGLSVKEYAFHSCKLGAATFAGELGIKMDDIRKLGRWKSQQMPLRYNRARDERIKILAQKFSAGLAADGH